MTADAAEAFDSTDYIFVTLPSNVQKDFAKRIAPLVSDKMKFVMVPGFGGAEFLMQPVLQRGAELFGFQRVPFIARLKEYGKSVWFEKKKLAYISQNFLAEILFQPVAKWKSFFLSPVKC